MKVSARTPLEQRVLVLAPTQRDAALSQSILDGASVPCHCVPTLADVVTELQRGAAALVLSEESIEGDHVRPLMELLRREPPWSDLPILVLARPGADSAGIASAIALLGNVTVLERPTRVAAFVSAIHAALRARRRQYQVRNHLDEREATARAMLRRSEQLHRLTEVLPLINAAADVPSILTVLCAQARELIGARRCDASLVRDPASHHPISVTSFSAEESDASFTRRTGEHRTIGSTTGPPSRAAIGASIATPPGARPALRDSLSAPLIDSDGRNMGHLHLSRSYGDGFTEEDEALLVQLAQLASIAVENALLVDSLREADRRKDEFLAVLAHELRNPLAPLRNSLYLLRLTHQADRAAPGVIEMMERQVNHMVRLVDDLLEVSRITRGKIELRMEDVRIADVIQSAIETSRPAIEAGRHEFTLSLPDEPVLLYGDPVRLAQVFSNLLNNAAKYTDPRGRIAMAVRCEGREVVATVRDSGIGIPGEMLPRVFDLFMQADRNGGRAQGGLGIGLTLVKSLVDMHGGRVTARSAGAGLGSEFEVRLPIASVHTEVGTPTGRRSAHGALAERRVLVVDDNHDAAESLGALLNLLGANTRIAFSGAEALEVLPTFRPEVVLLDIGMPGMDGHEVARRMHQQPGFADLPLVALTGWGQQQDRDKSHEAGFDFHLIKPADLDALRSILDSIAPHASPGRTADVTISPASPR